MAVDLQWGLLTNASANLGNALVQGAGQIRQRQEKGRDREAVRNYLSNPTDPGSFTQFAERDPAMAFRVREEQEQRQTRLSARQREELNLAARLVGRNPTDQGYVRDQATWTNARRLAQQAGLDVSRIPEAYDEQFVTQLRDYDRRVNRVAPVNVSEGARLVDPDTGEVIAQGAPSLTPFQRDMSAAGADYAPGTENYRTMLRNRYAPQPQFVIGPDGNPYLVQRGEAAPATPPPTRGEVTATNPQTGQRIRLNPQTGQWEPIVGAANPTASNVAPDWPVAGGAASVPRNFP